MAAGFLLAEYMPNDDEHLASNGNNGLAFVFAFLQIVEPSFPVGITAHGALGSFDHGPTQFTTAMFCVALAAHSFAVTNCEEESAVSSE